MNQKKCSMSLSAILQTQNLAFQRLPNSLGNRTSSVGKLTARETMEEQREKGYTLTCFLSKINDGDGGDDEDVMKHETFTENLVYIRYQSKHFKLIHLILKTPQNLNVHKRI